MPDKEFTFLDKGTIFLKYRCSPAQLIGAVGQYLRLKGSRNWTASKELFISNQWFYSYMLYLRNFLKPIFLVEWIHVKMCVSLTWQEKSFVTAKLGVGGTIYCLQSHTALKRGWIPRKILGLLNRTMGMRSGNGNCFA